MRTDRQRRRADPAQAETDEAQAETDEATSCAKEAGNAFGAIFDGPTLKTCRGAARATARPQTTKAPRLRSLMRMT
jgi:hypothetical protein